MCDAWTTHELHVILYDQLIPTSTDNHAVTD